MGRRASPGLRATATRGHVGRSPPEAVSAQVLCDFPHTAGAIPADYLLDLIPPIRPRAFSIASSLLVRACGAEPRAGLGCWAMLHTGM